VIHCERFARPLMRRSVRHRKQVAGRQRAAFTLIELLVVIAIISLLMSILLPSLRRARRQALQTECMANLKSISLAEHMYAAEYGGYFPGYSWLDADGVEQNVDNCYVPDPDGPGGYLSIGRHTDGNHMRVMAAHQSLFMRLRLVGDYVWCRDFTHQAMLEGWLVAYKWQARPNYNITFDMTGHFGCSEYDSPASSGVVARRTAVDPALGSGRCPHLTRLERVRSDHILLGERYQQRNNWSVGYGYPPHTFDYGAYQVGFRHPGPTANFAWMDASVHSWDLSTWLDNLESARAHLRHPE